MVIITEQEVLTMRHISLFPDKAKSSNAQLAWRNAPSQSSFHMSLQTFGLQFRLYFHPPNSQLPPFPADKC